ncbi:hypothetical protein RKD52_003238 [Metabacillus sp. SLBN-84]
MGRVIREEEITLQRRLSDVKGHKKTRCHLLPAKPAGLNCRLI